MVIQERTVIKKYSNYLRNLLIKKINRRRFSVFDNDVVRINCSLRIIAYALYDEDQSDLIAWVYLRRYKDWMSWEVMQVFVSLEYRNQGLAYKLYSTAIDQDDLIIMSGDRQAKSSRYLWQSFIKQNRFNIFATDILNLDKQSEIFYDEDEDHKLWCSLDVYEKVKSDQDIRLIASRK